MLNFAYNSQDPNKIVPLIEATLRKELGAPTQLPCQVIHTGENGISVKGLLLDALNFSTTLFLIQFSLSLPRPFQLQVKIDRQGLGALLGSLTYSAPLAKPVGGEVSLEPPKIFGNSKFVGEAQTTVRLNASGALIKNANKLTQTESELGQYRFEIERYLKIIPQAPSPLLVVHSLPRKTGLIGLSATLNSKDFFELLAQVEAAL
ncbi:hypothetical protein [Ktedonospora formicarum]|uniref:Uncharacterized protein n=1 Tax=Ktedonospora formicarum TaxID=2778364 RepID=A0A8J3IAH7_9CHLR|nr:hypothetical protein [Ktedonospora formicarum]GHO49042.1 hypothetical protein KSX_72050 [Ktedonospora formicarum]